ncbi:MAG: tRNA (cytidine(56)-2'-O)-methyltransferase [Candidatus Diapherotrites archaeon]
MLNERNDHHIAQTVEKINQTFGGKFKIEFYKNPWKTLQQFKEKGYHIIHLTMYGKQPGDAIKQIQKLEKIVIMIGADKVPGTAYQEADYNISITRQPHSEVAALSVFLHYLWVGKEEEFVFKGGKKTIIPSARGKNVQTQK